MAHMKWNRNPINGMRVVRKFAWFPVHLPYEYTVWLEYYYCVERWVCDSGSYWHREYTTQDKDEANRMLKCLNP